MGSRGVGRCASGTRSKRAAIASARSTAGGSSDPCRRHEKRQGRYEHARIQQLRLHCIERFLPRFELAFYDVPIGRNHHRSDPPPSPARLRRLSRRRGHRRRGPVADLEALRRGPVDGVLVENEYDRPHRVEAGPDTDRRDDTRVTRALVERASGARRSASRSCSTIPRPRSRSPTPSGASFIRTDYFVDPMERSEYGTMRASIPEALLALPRRRLGAERRLESWRTSR